MNSLCTCNKLFFYYRILSAFIHYIWCLVKASGTYVAWLGVALSLTRLFIFMPKEDDDIEDCLVVRVTFNRFFGCYSGEKIEIILRHWYGDYELLEYNHNYIQWYAFW